jgi:hypothetical protein
MQNVIKATPEEFDDMFIIQANVHFASLFASADKTLVAQSAQLVRNGGFAQPDALNQFPYTNFTLQQRGKYQNTRGIA